MFPPPSERLPTPCRAKILRTLVLLHPVGQVVLQCIGVVVVLLEKLPGNFIPPVAQETKVEGPRILVHELTLAFCGIARSAREVVDVGAVDDDVACVEAG